jgi:hypothetical protein
MSKMSKKKSSTAQSNENNQWSTYSLKTQLQTIFFVFAFASLIIVGISCVIFQYMSGDSTHNDVYDGFKKISENDMVMIMTDGSKLFDEKLGKLACNFPNFMAMGTSDLYRTDNPYGYVKSYYNWPGQLQNQYYDSNYNANITYDHSTFNVYAKTITQLGTLSNQIKNTINITAPMDYLFIPSFNNSKYFFAGYLATSTQFLRYYPGAINYNNITKYIMYNNIGDYWYETVIANKDETIYTSPYFDPIAKKLMITIGRTISNPDTNALIGAFGSDLILESIQNDIKNLTYLGKGRSILFEKETGYVIADSTNPITSIIAYNNIHNPQITTDTWTYLINNDKKLISQDNYYFVSINLETSNGQYMLVSLIDNKYIFETYSGITVQIDNMIMNNIYTVIGVFIGLTFLVLILAYFLTNRIATPLQKLADISVQISKNIGEDNLIKGVDLNIPISGIHEVDEIANNFRQSIEFVAIRNEPAENVYYGNIQWINSNYSVPNAITITPTAPKEEEPEHIPNSKTSSLYNNPYSYLKLNSVMPMVQMIQAIAYPVSPIDEEMKK